MERALRWSVAIPLLALAFRMTTTTAQQQLPLQTSLLSIYNSSIPVLLNGISGSYPRDAYASTYIIWSASGFPVALGNEGAGSLPVVAAAQVQPSGSKVVAFGHEGIPGSCCSNNDGWDKMTLNSVRWMAGTKTTITIASPDANGWASNGIAGVKSALTGIKVTVKTVDLDTFTAGGGKNVDIYWIDTYTAYTNAHVTALLGFMSQPGKGLLVGGHAWYWSYSHPNANIFLDLAINKVLWPLGLAVTTDAQYGFQPAPLKPPASWTYYNTYLDMSILAAAKQGTFTFNDTRLYPMVNMAITHVVKSLPPRASHAASGLTQLWSLVMSARPNITGGSPITTSKPMNRVTSYPGSVLDVIIESCSIRNGDITDLKPSLSAPSYPGVPPTTAIKGSYNITINGNYTRAPYRFGSDSPVWRSTGLYAPPGQVINVILRTVGAVGKGLQVQIGAHTDDLSFKDVWYRVPYAVSSFDLNTTSTSAGNPLGGLVFILVPSGSALGDVQITISSVIQAPYFRLNVTQPSLWASTIRNYPGPWAELDSGKIVIMMPSSVIRTVVDPVPLLQHWNRVMDSMAYLANMPTERAMPERFLVDVDISAGWMHAGYPIMAYDVASVHKEMLNVTYLKTVGAWGPYHELGHNHQWSEMQFSGTGESFNNLFTIYALERTGVPPCAWENWGALPDVRTALRADYFSKGPNWAADWSVWVALDFYVQLKEAFGWEFYRKLYAMYQQTALPLPDDNVQIWIQATSKVAGVNLIPTYQKWGFPVNQNTITALAALPAWDPNSFLP